MPGDVYRILSPTAILGYGFPEASLLAALNQELDLIAVDAGSMDAGPHYLGSSQQYVSLASVERDADLLVKAALSKGCPLVVGSMGFSGAEPQFSEEVEVFLRCIQARATSPVGVAIVPADIPTSSLEGILSESSSPQPGIAAAAAEGTLVPLGRMPQRLTVDVARRSKVVAQMGIEPIITALQAPVVQPGSGQEPPLRVQFVFCGRAYDPAVFAADPIRKGFDIGTTLHASKILECGAIACSPGSGADCLVA
eukprot:RCo026939